MMSWYLTTFELLLGGVAKLHKRKGKASWVKKKKTKDKITACKYRTREHGFLEKVKGHPHRSVCFGWIEKKT